MSLRGKIVVLFLGLAIVPILIVAGYGYWQASKLAKEVVAIALDTSVTDVADALDRSMNEVDRRIEDLADSSRLAQLIASPDLRQAWEEEVGGSLAPLSYMAVAVPGMGPIARAGVIPEPPERCTSGSGARLQTLTRTVRAGGREVVVEAGFWLDDLVEPRLLPRTGSILVFPRGGETALLSSSCEDLQVDVPAGLQAALVGSGRIQFEHEDQDWVASLVGLRSQPWSVAAYARTAMFLAPLQQLQASYWIFVLLLALATVLAFSMLLNRVVISLEDLTDAAALIGEGELNPWLPPPGRDEVGRLSLAFSIMLERIRNMMRRMDHSGRLAVVGQLTSYLAHEIRNPLSSIRINLQSLQRDVRKGRIPEECGEAVEVSLREVDRLSNSLTSVLQLGRPSGGEREAVSVHDIVEDVADLLTAEYRKGGVRLELDLDAKADRVLAVKGQLKGVFLNLLKNALEAQPDGGRVQIRSQLVSTPGRGPSVAVHVRDHGRGVPPELRTRIFEPFFTTKNQGSGIGLAVALRTVREHGGDLLVVELLEADAGSEFVVELPLAAVVAGSMPEPAVDLPSWMEAGDQPHGSMGSSSHPEGRQDREPTHGERDNPWIPTSIEILDHGAPH